MFARSYFAGAYFAPMYFPPVVALVEIVVPEPVIRSLTPNYSHGGGPGRPQESSRFIAIERQKWLVQKDDDEVIEIIIAIFVGQEC